MTASSHWAYHSLNRPPRAHKGAKIPLPGVLPLPADRSPRPEPHHTHGGAVRSDRRFAGDECAAELGICRCVPEPQPYSVPGGHGVPSFRTSDGVRIRYERHGDGPAIFVCQGGPNNICDTLIRDLAPLTATHTLIFHDYRGSGRSASAPADSYRFDQLADDLDELREHLGYPAVSVLAHSMGGFVALEFALRRPDRCTRLALVGTTPCGAARPMAIPTIRALGIRRSLKAGFAAVRYFGAWSWRPPSSQRTDAMNAPMNVTQEARPELRSRVAHAHPELPVASDNAADLMKAVGLVDLRGELHRIQCPVLVLYGTRDAVMVAGADLLVTGIAHAERRVLVDVGHEVFIEAPNDAFGALRVFLNT